MPARIRSRAAQPAKGKLFAREVDAIGPGSSRDAAVKLAWMLVKFMYDVVERSRRRMIQESVLLARQARGDSENSLALARLSSGGPWRQSASNGFSIVKRSLWPYGGSLSTRPQTPIDAGELRGMCIRALESYPDHPGLLLVRAAAESMCSDRDDSVVLQGISAAIRKSSEDYELPQTEVEAVIDKLFDLGAHAGRPIWDRLSFPHCSIWMPQTPIFRSPEKKGLERAAEIDNPFVQAATATRRLHGIVGLLETAVGRVIRRWDEPGVKQAMQRGLT